MQQRECKKFICRKEGFKGASKFVNVISNLIIVFILNIKMNSLF